MKRQRSTENGPNQFDLLSEEIVFLILDLISDNPLDSKSFSLACRSFYDMESRHRRCLRLLTVGHFSTVMNRYPNVAHLDLSACSVISDASLAATASRYATTLQSINISRSRSCSSGLFSLAQNCMNLVEIDVSGAIDMKDSGAAAIAEAKNLQRLFMARCRLVTDVGIGRIALGCRKLVSVSMKWCLNVGDLGVNLLVLKCNFLRKLDISYLPISDECLSGILRVGHIEELTLEGCLRVRDHSLTLLKRECNSLKKLDLSNCKNITHAGLSSLISSAGSLHEINLANGCPATLALAGSLKKLPMLQFLRLDGCAVSTSGLMAIGNSCLSLVELSLRKCDGVADEGLSYLAMRNKKLRKLDITCCHLITDVSISNIANSCPLLTSLNMEACSSVYTHAFISIGKHCHLLETLDLTETDVDDEGLKSISRCQRLSTLKLGICLNITDLGLIELAISCSKLLHLDLYRSVGIGDQGISAVGRCCPRLEAMNMSYCTGVTDRSLLSLSRCSRLTTLECRGCPELTSLGLSAIAVGCRQLSKLDIKNCSNVDDVGMIPLSHFSRNLTEINLSHTSVTCTGLLSLSHLGRLQTMQILYVDQSNPYGVAVAILSCRHMKKVKLHKSLSSSIPPFLLWRLEARGCVLQWKDGPVLQPEHDPESREPRK